MAGTGGWVALPGPPGPPGPAPVAYAATAVTDGNGVAAFTYPPGLFADPPVVAVTVQAGSGFRSARVVTNTADGCTVEVFSSAGITLLGIGVLAAGAPASGVTVNLHAAESG